LYNIRICTLRDKEFSMACLVCRMGRFRKIVEGGKPTYYCGNCRGIIKFCVSCGAEIVERRDETGLFIACVERCGWMEYLFIHERKPYSLARLKALMEERPAL
jgi:hypothetical protein